MQDNNILSCDSYNTILRRQRDSTTDFNRYHDCVVDIVDISYSDYIKREGKEVDIKLPETWDNVNCNQNFKLLVRSLIKHINDSCYYFVL